MSKLVAGVAKLPLPLPPGVPLMGYALRQGVASGELDALFARAAYVAQAQDVLLVALDLCLLAPAQTTAVRARLSARTGVPVDRILVSCIHTHSGPDTGLGEILGGGDAPAHVAALLDTAVEAGVRAVGAAAPVRIGFGAAALAIGRNRCIQDGPVDPAARILRIDRADGSPLAILWLHGCHPTVLGHENLAVSADWPGAAHARIEAAFPGALSMFLLSAHADIDPRTRGLQDLARPNRSLGADAAAMQAIGAEAGDAVVSAAAGIPTASDVRVGAASRLVPLAVHGGADAEAAAGSLALRKRDALLALDLSPDALVRVPELYRLADECVERLPAAEARERVACVRLYLRDRAAPYFAGGRSVDVEVQALRIGDARWLALPLEPTVAVGADWSARLGDGHAAVLSVANGWLRYLPSACDFALPQAHQGYEVLSSTFEPAAAGRLLTLGEELLSAFRD